MYHDTDADLVRAWQLLHELSEQNAHNLKLSTALRTQASTLKVRVRPVVAEATLSCRRSDLGRSRSRL